MPGPVKLNFINRYGRVAQLLEQLPLKEKVLG